MQIAYALQSANISRIFSTLGADPHSLSYFWILPPLAGIIVQPIIGALSDRTWTRFGRRIPYLFAGALVAVCVMCLLPNAGSFGMTVSAAMVFGLISLMFLDTSINMAMQPFKMMVGDMVNEKQKGLAYSIQSFLCNAGSLAGYLFPFIFAAIGISVACLLIMGTFTLVAYNANENLSDLQQENAVVAFVDDSLTETQARDLQAQLEKVDNVADCTFMSRDEAKENYIEKYDGDELYGDLPADVFRHRYVIHVTDPDRIMETKTAVEQVTGIAKARADQAVAEGFTTARNVASIISIALIAILLLVSVFIISNTIKLTTFDRRDEIAIMKMVGATNGFIRWPFVFEGLLLGLFSAVIAFGLQWLLYTAVARGIGTSDSLQILTVIPFEQIWQPVALVFLGAGILVGVGGSLTAIRRFLRV